MRAVMGGGGGGEEEVKGDGWGWCGEGEGGVRRGGRELGHQIKPWSNKKALKRRHGVGNTPALFSIHHATLSSPTRRRKRAATTAQAGGHRHST